MFSGSKGSVSLSPAGVPQTLCRKRKLLAGICAAFMLVSSFSGCSSLHSGIRCLSSGGWNDAVVNLRNRSFSLKAWHRRKHHFCHERHLADFCAGFRAGYEDVANGGGECTPAFPPQQYWSWQFQSAEGQARTAAWFAGYPHGARAAEEDGVGSWNQIAMSSGMQAQCQQHGIFGHEGAVYPIPDPNSGLLPGAVVEGYEVHGAANDLQSPAPAGESGTGAGILDPTTP